MIAGRREEETAGLKRSGEVCLVHRAPVMTCIHNRQHIISVQFNCLFTCGSSLLIKDLEQWNFCLHNDYFLTAIVHKLLML